MMPTISLRSRDLFEQFKHTVDEMKRFPRESANYVTLKSHAAQLLDQLLESVPDEFVELLYKRIQEAR